MKTNLDYYEFQEIVSGMCQNNPEIDFSKVSRDFRPNYSSSEIDGIEYDDTIEVYNNFQRFEACEKLIGTELKRWIDAVFEDTRISINHIIFNCPRPRDGKFNIHKAIGEKPDIGYNVPLDLVEPMSSQEISHLLEYKNYEFKDHFSVLDELTKGCKLVVKERFIYYTILKNKNMVIRHKKCIVEIHK